MTAAERAAAVALSSLRAADNTPTYEQTVIAAQARATPMLSGLVHFFAGWLKGGINFTGCDLRLVRGVTVAGRCGSADETTCPACLVVLRGRGMR